MNKHLYLQNCASSVDKAHSIVSYLINGLVFTFQPSRSQYGKFIALLKGLQEIEKKLEEVENGYCWLSLHDE